MLFVFDHMNNELRRTCLKILRILYQVTVFKSKKFKKVKPVIFQFFFFFQSNTSERDQLWSKNVKNVK